MRELTRDFVQLLYNVSQRDLSEELLHQCRRLLLDYLGVTVAGAHTLRKQTHELLDRVGDGSEVMVIGTGRRSNLLATALVNGIHAHVLELDDGIRFGSVHPGAPVFSALLPAAEKHGWSWERVFRGVVAGYECASRLSEAIQPQHRSRGYHATGTVGTVATAVAIAAAGNYSFSEMRNAFAAAVLSASGMLKAMEGGSDLKPYNAGQAAMSGLSAASMAAAGFNAPEEVLGGDRGFFKLTTDIDKVRIADLLEDSRGSLGVDRVYVKPYAACRHAHAPIEAILRMRQQGLVAEEVESIHVSTYSLAVGGHDHVVIDGVGSAKMSTPYSVAVALIDGVARLEQFSESRICDEIVLKFAEKVSVELDSELDSCVPKKRPAVVEVRTRNGTVHKERVDLPKGEPETPLNDHEIGVKFEDLVITAGWGKPRAQHVAHVVFSAVEGLLSLWQHLSDVNNAEWRNESV